MTICWSDLCAIHFHVAREAVLASPHATFSWENASRTTSKFIFTRQEGGMAAPPRATFSRENSSPTTFKIIFTWQGRASEHAHLQLSNEKMQIGPCPNSLLHGDGVRAGLPTCHLPVVKCNAGGVGCHILAAADGYLPSEAVTFSWRNTHRTMFQLTFPWAAIDTGGRPHVTMVPGWAVARQGVAAPSTAGLVSSALVRS